MQLIVEKLGKTAKYDRLRLVRGDGSEAFTSMPRQGTLPHDLVHYVVESALGLRHGFLGLVADGCDPAFVMQAAHDRSCTSIEMETAQAEAVVEALQTQLWNGRFDRDAFAEAVRLTSAARGKPAFDFSGIDLETALYNAALLLAERWSQVPWHRTIELDFLSAPS